MPTWVDVSVSPVEGPRSPTRTSNRAYPRPEAPLNIRLDQIKARSCSADRTDAIRPWSAQQPCKSRPVSRRISS
eukprot:4816740-Amphidinium_carterae.1